MNVSTILASRSLLSKESLLKSINETYSENFCTIFLVRRGANDTYVLKGEKGPSILRVYSERNSTEGKIRAEHDLLLFLKEACFSAAAPKQNKAGNTIGWLPAPEGNRAISLFEFAEGRPMTLTNASAKDFGELIGRLHFLADEYQKTSTAQSFRRTKCAKECTETILSLVELDSNDCRFLNMISEAIDSESKSWENVGIIHGDFFHNAHWKEGKLKLFDFDESSYGPRAFEVAMFAWGVTSQDPGWKMEFIGEPNELFESFLSGYFKWREIGDSDLVKIPLCILWRQLWDLNIQVVRTEDHGIYCFDGEAIQSRLRSMRDWASEIGIA